MKKTNRIKYFSVLVLAAFLVNVLLPFFAVYTLPPSNAGNLPQSSLFGERVLICTADGFKWVSLADLQGEQQRSESHRKYQCALCYISAQGIKDTIPGKTVVFIADQRRKYTALAVADRNRIGRLKPGSIKTRAPPTLT